MNWFKTFWQKLTAPPRKPRTTSVTTQPTDNPAPPPVLKPSWKARTREGSVPNFTPRAQQTLALARKEAEHLRHNYVGTEHVLLGMITFGQGTGVTVLRNLGLNLDTVRAEIEKQIGTGPGHKITGNIPYTPRVKKVLALAIKEAKALNDTYVGTGHIVLGFLREADGVAGRVLQTMNVDLEKARAEVLKVRESKSSSASEKVPNLSAEAERIERKTEELKAQLSAQKTSMETTIDSPKPPREPVDTAQRYDVYCSPRDLHIVIYRNVRFKSVKTLFQRHANDYLSDFVELEQPDGQSIFVAKSTVIRFCAPGVKPNAEEQKE